MNNYLIISSLNIYIRHMYIFVLFHFKNKFKIQNLLSIFTKKKSMKIFITGIDTDSGKSIVTGLLAKYLLNKAQSVITQKYIQTGCKDFSEDIQTHRNIMGIGILQDDKNGFTCSYLFKHPASPHLASHEENIIIDPEQFTKATLQLSKKYKYVLMEGAGGLMVPLTQTYNSLDYLIDQNFPIILVSSSKLGSINHTLLSLEVLKNKGLHLIGLVYNQFPNIDSAITIDTENFLRTQIQNYFPNCPFISIPEIDLKNPPIIDFSPFFSDL